MRAAKGRAQSQANPPGATENFSGIFVQRSKNITIVNK